MVEWSLLAPTIILLGAAFTDVQSHKIYNKWVVISIFLALLSSFLCFQFAGLQQGALAAGVALLLTLPLVLLGALGAGDMKILFAFGLAQTYSAVFSVVVISFLWAAIIGIGLSIVRGRAKILAKNTYKILTAQPRDESSFQKIPYSVALFLAWITYILMGLQQGAF